MTVNWIIERDVFSNSCFDVMCSRVRERGDNLHVVRIVPFAHELEKPVRVNDSLPTVCYGSIGIEKVARQQGWKPGVFSGNFDSEAYATHLGDNFLNASGQVYSLEHYAQLCRMSDENYSFFCKPNDDFKAFAGQVFQASEFSDWIDKMRDCHYIDEVDFDVVVAPVRELAMEYRCLVVGDEIVDMSIYRQWQRAMPERVWDRDVHSFATSCARQYSPADVFMIDVAQTHDGLKVVEYNTFNTAGLYAMDAALVVDRISEFVC